MKHLFLSLCLLLPISLFAQKNSNKLKFSFSIAETAYLTEPSIGYEVRYERNSKGMLSFSLGYGISYAKKEVTDAFRTLVLSGVLTDIPFSFTKRENFTYLDINGCINFLPKNSKWGLKIGGGMGVLRNQLIYINSLEYEFSLPSGEVEYDKNIENTLVSIFLVEGEYSLTDQFTLFMKFSRRKTQRKIKETFLQSYTLGSPNSIQRIYYKIYRMSIDLGFSIYL